MENRRNQRIPAMLKLFLFKDGAPIAVGRTHDVSAGGVFVQTDFSNFDAQFPTEMELLSNKWTRVGGNCRYRTLVTRSTSDGFGLRFDNSSEAQRRAIVVAAENNLDSRRMPFTDTRIKHKKEFLS